MLSICLFRATWKKSAANVSLPSPCSFIFSVHLCYKRADPSFAFATVDTIDRHNLLYIRQMHDYVMNCSVLSAVRQCNV